MWSVLGPIINPNKHRKQSAIMKLMYNDQITTNSDTIPDILNDYFCNVGHDLQNKIPAHDPSSFKEYLPEPILNSFFLSRVSEEDVLREIKQLIPKKASGYDNIGGKILQICPEIFSQHLAKIFNHYIDLGILML